MDGSSTPKSGGGLKALIFGLFIVGAIALIRFTPVKDYVTSEMMGELLASAGHWAPLLYIVVYAAVAPPCFTCGWSTFPSRP